MGAHVPIEKLHKGSKVFPCFLNLQRECVCERERERARERERESARASERERDKRVRALGGTTTSPQSWIKSPFFFVY